MHNLVLEQIKRSFYSHPDVKSIDHAEGHGRADVANPGGHLPACAGKMTTMEESLWPMAAFPPFTALANFLYGSRGTVELSRSDSVGHGANAGNRRLNYIHSACNQSSIPRIGLFCLVLVLHIGFLISLSAIKTKTLELPIFPLMVEFVDLPESVEADKAAAQPLPMVAPPKPIIIRQQPTPKKPAAPVPKPQPTPPLETTASSEPALTSVPLEAAPTPSQAPTTDIGNQGEGERTLAASEAKSGRDQSEGNGAVVGARFNADYLRNPAPFYPPQSKRLGEEGKVILRVFVSTEGNAEQIEVKTSSGSNRLDESALRTVWRWKFIPAKRADVAIESWVLVPILFRLE